MTLLAPTLRLEQINRVTQSLAKSRFLLTLTRMCVFLHAHLGILGTLPVLYRRHDSRDCISLKGLLHFVAICHDHTEQSPE